MTRWLRIKRRHLWIAIPKAEDALAIIVLVMISLVGIFGLTYGRQNRNLSRQVTRQQQQSVRQPPIESRSTRWWYTDVAPNWALVLIGALTAWAALQTLKSIQQDVRASSRSATAAKDNAVAASHSAEIQANTLAATIEIERAYISLTNKKVLKTGGRMVNDPAASITIDMSVRNSGRTPGNVLGGYFGWTIFPKPQIPDILSFMRLDEMFLLPGEEVTFGITIPTDTNHGLREVLEGTSSDNKLWIVGVVEYCDRFDQMHMNGYCRAFSEPPYELFQIVNGTGPFNFDRRLTTEEQQKYAKDRSSGDAELDRE